MYTFSKAHHVPRAVFAALVVCLTAAGQDQAGRLDQLKAQYKLVKVGFLGHNTAKEDPTALLVQKQGIFGVGLRGLANPTATYADGVLHSPGKTAAMLSGSGYTHWFEVNEKVFPMKFELDLKADRIGVMIVSSDYAYKGRVQFQFARGFLSTATTAQVQDVIGQVFSIDSGDNNAQPVQQTVPPTVQPTVPPTNDAIDSPPAQVAPTQFQPIQPPPQPAEPLPPPRTVQSGQTQEAVVATLGQPEKIVDLGSKVIYLYHNLKIIFVNGKVDDVQ